MTGLSLRNPIAILMLCIALVVFAGVLTPRMAVDTFPELTPPVLIISGVASAAPDGGRLRQINVVVDPTKAQAAPEPDDAPAAPLAEARA